MTDPHGLLVIGFGNTLRRDDAAGPRVAEAVAALNLPAVSVIVRHQLTPELAEAVSSAGAVVFVDAAAHARAEVELKATQPRDGLQTLGHSTDPASILALARSLFGRCPRSWTLAIPAEDFEFGDGLSPLAESGVRIAVKEIQRLADPSYRAPDSPPSPPSRSLPPRLKLAIIGSVQGVGFRPFVHRLATELHLTGWVNNSPQGVAIEVEGDRASLDRFLLRVREEKPRGSCIQSLEASWLAGVGHVGFEIRKSGTGGDKTTPAPADVATCSECLREILDPRDRRYRYPFSNCTHCGPRFSIVESLPYDRMNTSMKSFAMCPACRAEYGDPLDRRFHAQTNACPDCGPHLEFWNADGQPLSSRHEALLAAAEAIRQGLIVAVKGIGGFHLLADARDAGTVGRLRQRKHRDQKPFALMFPSLASVRAVCRVSALEDQILTSAEAPIVLLERTSDETAPIAASVAPGHATLGIMLPYSPLHHLLLAELGFPVVATSGNRGDETICTEEHEAVDRLHGVADAFLVHDRPIIRHLDDSIVRVMVDRPMVLRRARGFAPLPIQIHRDPPTPGGLLGVGAHQKSSVALLIGDQVILSQHIGDLETEQSDATFRRVIGDLERLYEVNPGCVAPDLHPDYASSKFARERMPTQRVEVQHHEAHVLSCMADNELEPPLLGVAWDGSGYGQDGTLWGGEFFLVTAEAMERVAHFRPFRLPGGDLAAREPRRAALGLLHEMARGQPFERAEPASVAAFSRTEIGVLRTMLARGLNSPLGCSVGRLFDAVASLTGLRHHNLFEGQAAMDLEFALRRITTRDTYPLEVDDRRTPLLLDWSPMIEAILEDVNRRVPVGVISARFHNTLAGSLASVAARLGATRVALSGGCFQNRYLLEHAVSQLRERGIETYWHQRVPPNDGGIALGQIIAAMRSLK